MKFLKNIILFLLLFATALNTKAQTQFLGTPAGTIIARGDFTVDSTLGVKQRLRLGTATGNSLLNFPDAGTTAADGISFGSNISLYRAGSGLMYWNGVEFVLNTGYFRTASIWGTTSYNNSIQLNTSGITLTPTVINAGTLTGSSATSALSISQTWNTTGNPTLIFANVTNTASGATASLIDLQVGGVSMFSVSKAGTMVIGGGLSTNSTIQVAQGSDIRWNNRSRIYSDASGTIRLMNSALTDFDRLQFGGSTSSFPALKRNGTAIQVRLADDSGFGGFTASNVNSVGNLYFGNFQNSLKSNSSGVIQLQNTSENDFDRLQWGGSTSSFPSLKRSSANLQVRLADDSGFTGFEASTITGTQYRLSALNTAPSSASDTGTLGEIRVDANFIYICTATNTWKRVAIATW